MELLSYDFVQRGIVAGLVVGVTSAVAGVFLILRRMAFLGAGLSHASFGGVALSMLLDLDPFLFTIIFTLLVGNLVQLIASNRRVPGDAAIAMIFSGGVALAVLILGITKGFSEYLFGYLFGNILMVSGPELLLTLISSFTVLLFFGLFYRRLLLLIFSEELARLRGVNVKLMNHALVSLASLVVVLSMKVVGIILASSMIVVPALTALLIAGSFRGALLISVAVSTASVLSGILLAFYYDLPPSGTVVGSMVLLFGIAFLKRLFSPLRF